MELYFNTIPTEINAFILDYLDIQDSDIFLMLITYRKNIINLCISQFYPKLSVTYLHFSKYYNKKQIYYIFKSYYIYLMYILCSSPLFIVYLQFIDKYFFTKKPITFIPSRIIHYSRPVIYIKDNMLSKYLNLSLLFELLFQLTFPKSYFKLNSHRDKVKWVTLYPNLIFIIKGLYCDHVYSKKFSDIQEDIIGDEMLTDVIPCIQYNIRNYKELLWISD